LDEQRADDSLIGRLDDSGKDGGQRTGDREKGKGIDDWMIG